MLDTYYATSVPPIVHREPNGRPSMVVYDTPEGVASEQDFMTMLSTARGILKDAPEAPSQVYVTAASSPRISHGPGVAVPFDKVRTVVVKRSR